MPYNRDLEKLDRATNINTVERIAAALEADNDTTEG